MPYDGRGSEVDKEKGLQIYQDAADSGGQNSLLDIAHIYANGDGARKSDYMANDPSSV